MKTAATPKPAKRKSTVRGTHAERSALSDQRLVAETIRLLVAEGVDNATLQAIAAAAGYSHTLIVHRYGGRAGLLRRVMEVVQEQWQGGVQARLAGKTGIEALCAIIDTHLWYLNEHPDELRAMYRLWFHGAAPGSDYRRGLGEIHRRQNEQITSFIAPASAPRAARAQARLFADRFSALLSGFIYQWLTDPELPIAAIFAGLQQELRSSGGLMVVPVFRSPVRKAR